jgi:metal-dependent amidase/aminoacylase/carboxypeptidase family protein
MKMSLKLLSLFVALAVQTGVRAQINSKINSEVKQQTKYALELCKYLHQNPELSFQEFETSARLAAELKKVGFEVTEKVGGNNAVGILKNGDGPVIMIRTDMDALPVQEKTGLAFASIKKAKNADGNEVSVMHACGHDIHM